MVVSFQVKVASFQKKVVRSIRKMFRSTTQIDLKTIGRAYLKQEQRQQISLPKSSLDTEVMAAVTSTT